MSDFLRSKDTLWNMLGDKSIPELQTDLGVVASFMENNELRRIDLITGSYWKFNVLNKYGDRKFLFYGTIGYHNFKNCWANFVEEHAKDFNILAQAYFRNYNPLENYDKYSDISLSYLGTETNELLKDSSVTVTEAGKEKETLTKEGKEKNTFTPQGIEKDTLVRSGKENNKTTVSKTPFDTGTFSDVEKSDTDTVYGSDGTTRKDETTKAFLDDRKDINELEYLNGRKDTTTTSFEDRSTTSVNSGGDTNTKSFENREDKTVEHTHGQIGVTANYQLIDGETKTRMKALCDRIIDAFILEYTVLSFVEE